MSVGIAMHARMTAAEMSTVRSDDRLNASFASSFLPCPTNCEHTIEQPVEKMPAMSSTMLEKGPSNDMPE